MSYDVIISEKARYDIVNIYRYIAIELCEPETARNKISDIRATLENLNFMPERHPLYRDEPLKSMGIRILPFEKYLILYYVDNLKSEVNIVRIIYGGKDLKTQLDEI